DASHCPGYVRTSVRYRGTQIPVAVAHARVSAIGGVPLELTDYPAWRRFRTFTFPHEYRGYAVSLRSGVRAQLWIDLDGDLVPDAGGVAVIPGAHGLHGVAQGDTVSSPLQLSWSVAGGPDSAYYYLRVRNGANVQERYGRSLATAVFNDLTAG